MTPRVALLVIGDGRDALREQALDSFARHAGGAYVSPIVQIDDRHHRLGFCGAIQAGWRELAERHAAEPFDYVFHLEEDWLLLRDVALDAMSDLLDAYPALAQVALRRGAENDAERAAGGLIGLWPDEYLDKTLYTGREAEGHREAIAWLEHGLFFTTNPSLYPARLVEHGWPSAPRCEEVFGEGLKHLGYRFAYLGTRLDEPWIAHTGSGQRQGKGY